MNRAVVPLTAGSHQGVTKSNTTYWTQIKCGGTASLTQRKSGDNSRTTLMTQLKSDAQDGDLKNKKATKKEVTDWKMNPNNHQKTH